MIIFPPAFTESVVEHLTGGAVVGDPLTDLVHKLPVRSVPRGGECAAFMEQTLIALTMDFQ